MRFWWILPILGGCWIPSAVFGDDGKGPGAAPNNGPANQSAPGEPGQFRPRPPFGAFQPTDIGGDEGGNQTPPLSLAPEGNVAPAGGGESFQLNDSQNVAPAQFQAPLNAKSPPAADPSTKVVPAAGAPALQSAPNLQAPPAAAPPVQPSESEPQNLAQSLYQQSLNPPPSGSIAGTGLTLSQALARRTDSSRYAEFVKGYWRLSQALAAYHDAIQSARELAQLPQPRLQLQQVMLQAAGATAEAEVRQAKLEFVSLQWEMADQLAGAAAPPLPQDPPLLAAYKSKFEAVFAGRTPPPGARRLHETFDVRLAVIEGRATAVVAAEHSFGAVADGYANGQLTVADALREHARLQAARRDFLQSAYDYNAAIADYAWLAAGPRSAETISSMLVERRRLAANADAAPANFVAPAAASILKAQ